MSYYEEGETITVEEMLPNIFTEENKECNFNCCRAKTQKQQSNDDFINYIFTFEKKNIDLASDVNMSELSTASRNYSSEIKQQILEKYSPQNSQEFNENSQLNLLDLSDASDKDEDSRANTHMIIETILQRQLVTDQNQTIVQERNDTDDFNLENEPSSEPSDIKKGKSNALPEEVSTIYTVIKEYYEKLPAIFRLDGIRKKNKTHFFNWVKRLLDQKLIRIPDYKKTKFKKLNQDTLSNINLTFNSILFKKTVYEVYSDDSVENYNLMQTLILNYNFPNQESDTLMLFLITPLYQVYDLYLESPEFKSDFKKIEKKTRKEADHADPVEKQYILLYLEVYKILSREFVKYYMSTVPNERSSPTNRRPNRDNRDRQDLNATIETVERVETVITDSEQGNSASTKEESYSMFESESDSGSEFY